MKMKISQGKAVTLSLLITTLLAVPGRAALFEDIFVGGSGIWHEDFNWSQTAYPSNGHTRNQGGNPIPGPNPTYNAVINIAMPCNLNTSATLEGVSMPLGPL